MVNNYFELGSRKSFEANMGKKNILLGLVDGDFLIQNRHRMTDRSGILLNNCTSR